MGNVNSGWWLARLSVLAIAAFTLAGCGFQWSAGFPEVPLQKPASGAMKIGVAQVEDSRPNYAVGWVGSSQLLAGPDLPNYIERKFRNELAERGFDPVEALDPARTTVAQPYKVVVVTLQSAEFNSSGWYFATASSKTRIGVRVYSRAGRTIFNGQYSGNSVKTASNKINSGVVAGGLMAPAINNAVSAAFAERQFEQALR